MRRLGAVLALASLTLTMWAPGPASATDYRYWTYWTGTANGWTFSQVGPASAVPEDGSVEGWRFALSTGVRGQGAEPRIAATAAFRQFCGPQPAAPGAKRVAVVFDFGLPGEAPDGQTPPRPRGTCVEAPEQATGATILSRSATVRSDDGLVCAIGGYPQGECAPAVTSGMTSSPRATPRSTPRSVPSEEAPSDRDTSKQDEGMSASTAGDAESAGGGRSAIGDAGGDTTTDPGTARDGTRDRQPERRDRPTPTPVSTPPPDAGSPTQPTFIAADAQIPTDAPASQAAWPLLLTALAVAAVGGLFWWRRRS